MKFPRPRWYFRLSVALGGALAGAMSCADTVTVAVASNFVTPLTEIAESFGRTTGHTVRIVPGSSGRLYAQIRNGAPFDVFLSADSDRPARLEADELAVSGSRFTYAIGQLVLLSADPETGASGCREALAHLGEDKLAIANPAVAPYGAAAVQFLREHNLLEAVTPHLVFGENISQTFQFFATGNARYALIARSQLHDDAAAEWQISENGAIHGCVAPAGPSSDDVLAQQAVLLVRARESRAAALFLDSLRGDDARRLIGRRGYRLPEADE